jgi:hypothetical protein
MTPDGSVRIIMELERGGVVPALGLAELPRPVPYALTDA